MKYVFSLAHWRNYIFLLLLFWRTIVIVILYVFVVPVVLMWSCITICITHNATIYLHNCYMTLNSPSAHWCMTPSLIIMNTWMWPLNCTSVEIHSVEYLHICGIFVRSETESTFCWSWKSGCIVIYLSHLKGQRRCPLPRLNEVFFHGRRD